MISMHNKNINLEQIKKVAKLLKNCESILFITGAGISADSGLPTYRGIGGLYEDKDTEEGIPVEMALAGEMLATRPSITWKYLSQIEQNCRHATFNRAHAVIAEMEKHFARVWVLTQNVDGFHQTAGSKNVIDIHGDIHNLFCPECGYQERVDDFSEIQIPPICPECGHIIRPGVVLFGEQLPYQQTQILFEQQQKGFDIYFSVGTTSVFPYIQRPILEAKALNRATVEINLSETQVSHLVDIKIPLRAAEALDAIWKEYKGQ